MVAVHTHVAIGIPFVLVALVLVGFAASRVMARKRPTTVQEDEQQRPSSPLRRPHYVPRLPRDYALPPVTIETLPIDFKQVRELVPPIDRGALAALRASDSRTAEIFARGSSPPGSDLDDAETLTTQSDVDGAETVRPASDLDDDLQTRTHMSPVR